MGGSPEIVKVKPLDVEDLLQAAEIAQQQENLL
jgi:hypothetical protein